MVESTGITIENVYLDGREKNILAGGVSSLEDDTIVHNSENRTTSTYEKSSRVRRGWQLSWSVASTFVSNLFHVFRNAKGFLFISPVDEERLATGMPIRNTVTGLNTGDGSTTTFQAQFQISVSKDIGSGSVSSDIYDVEYLLGTDRDGSVVAYANGTPVTVSGWSETTGIITLSSAPSNGAVMTADFQYAIPVMFTSKNISRTLLQVDQTELRSAQIEEVF